MASNKQICEAVRANRGGHENTPDAAMMRLWRSLDKATQEKYLESIKKKGAAGAVKS